MSNFSNSPAATRPAPEPRSGYKAFRAIGTRWMDNDAYGHVNNVVYYSWFDTAVNAYLIEQGARRWPSHRPWTRAFAWRGWARPVCVMKWGCLRKAKN